MPRRRRWPLPGPTPSSWGSSPVTPTRNVAADGIGRRAELEPTASASRHGAWGDRRDPPGRHAGPAVGRQFRHPAAVGSGSDLAPNRCCAGPQARNDPGPEADAAVIVSGTWDDQPGTAQHTDDDPPKLPPTSATSRSSSISLAPGYQQANGPYTMELYDSHQIMQRHKRSGCETATLQARRTRDHRWPGTATQAGPICRRIRS